MCAVTWAWTIATVRSHSPRFAGSSRFTFIPWDKDLSFIGVERSIFSGLSDNVLTRRLMAIPEYHAYFLQSVAEAANIMGGPGGLLQQTIDTLYSQIVDTAKRDPYKQCAINGFQVSCGPGEFETTVQQLRDFAPIQFTWVMSEVAVDGGLSSN